MLVELFRGLILLRSGLALALVANLVSAASAEDAPRVIGFERFFAHAPKQIAAGQLLLGELNCTSCHQAGESSPAGQQAVILRKPAPVLDTVGRRVRPQYLQKFLADPQGTKPGTTMPGVLSHLPVSERAATAEALVHFLAATGAAADEKPLQQSVARGETLYHSVGCVACHDPRQEPAIAQATSIPLGVPSRKYTVGGLAEFLQDPLAVRPGARMPSLNLSPAEARDIASYLLNDLETVSGLQYAYYEGDWEKLPDFRTLTPLVRGDADDFSLKVAKRQDHFGLRFEGSIKIDVAGDYLFLVGSDDGARLLIDGNVVVTNDGVHAFEQKRKKIKLAAGLHAIVVEYFEHEGDQTLQLDFEAPGMTQQPLTSLLTAPASSKETLAAAEKFPIDNAKAAKGKEHFAALGCAACHTLKVDAVAVAATNKAKPLIALAGLGGCLEGADVRLPQYNLSPPQQAALATAISALKQPAAKPSSEEFISQTLVRFNCVACHQRNNLGGVEEPRNVWFQTDMPEMGDEGRIPPHLTGVGAKLNPAWLKTLFDEGGRDRPYMLTRMPKFTAANLHGLIPALEAVDARLVQSASFAAAQAADEEKRIKAAGRRLVGAQGFSCIKCHTFAGKRASGIQAVSLTTMTKRLRPEWFYHYLLNPAAYRPGTRMPTAFPDGQTTLPMVLDGTVASQIGAIWSYLADGDKASLPPGLVTGKIELIAFDEPVIYRNFIEGAGTRAIGVGYPERLNLAFDANELRLALLWQGAFIDAAKHWSARGAGFEGPLGEKIVKPADGPPFAQLISFDDPWPKQSSHELGFQFRGYRLGDKKRPTFVYSWNGLNMEDSPLPVGEPDLYVMQRTIKVSGHDSPRGLWFRAARAGKVSDLGRSSFKIDDRWTLRISASAGPSRRQQDGQWEVLVPITFKNGQANVDLTYDW